MAIYHRTQRLQIYGEKPEVTQLFGGRYRMEVRCVAAKDTEAWYNDNKDQIFASFGTLYSAEMSIDGIGPRVGEAYANMVLISNKAGYTPTGEYVISFVYETLTSSWVKEKEDVTSSTDNGLRTLTRTEVAKIDTAAPYDEDDVGISTITDNAKTLYLAGFENQTKADDEVQIGRFVTRWAEAGVLSVSSRNMSEGVQSVETVFLAVEGTTTGPVYSRRTQNYEGFKTISVTTLQDKSGNSIVNGGSNLVHQYNRKVEFTYPGTVGVRQDILTGTPITVTSPNLLNFEIKPPVQSKVDATVSVIFQTSGSIVAGDETYDDGSGAADSYWNPTEWAQTYTSGIGWNFAPFVETQALRGYRVDNDVSGITENTAPTGEINFNSNGVTIITSAGTAYLEAVASSSPIKVELNGVGDTTGNKYIVNGRRIYGSTPFTMRASGGPVDPSGTKYVLDIDIRPAFEDVDGNVYYKKTIVTATV
jgi:hypothetical protein